MEAIMEQSTIIGGGIVLTLIMLAIREGMLQKYIYRKMKPAEKRKLSKQWHAVGGIARVLLIALTVVAGWSWLAAAAVAGSLLYNVAINLYKGHKWWYVGTVALTDRIIRKLFFFINFDKGL